MGWVAVATEVGNCCAYLQTTKRRGITPPSAASQTDLEPVSRSLQQSAAPVFDRRAPARLSRSRQYIRDLLSAPDFRPGAPVKSACLAEAAGRGLAGAAVLLDLEVDLLTFNEVRHASAFDSGDVDENVRAAIVRLDEAETLGSIEPLYGTSCHFCVSLRLQRCLTKR
jgi:hypothetical protein